MGIFKYPYTDLHELNLDMILRMIKELDHEMDDFIAANKITNAGAWDITRQYQAWTVVSDNNIGYISLKPVPAGISIFNTEYWGVIADYDILITDLSARISALEAEDIRINTKLNRLINRKFIFVGDSYNTNDTPPGGTQISPWGEMLATYLNLTSSDYYNTGVSGAGFVAGTNFKTQLQNVYAGMSGSVPNNITDIVVLGGINDYNQSMNDIDAAIDDFCTYATGVFPNAKIWIGLISNTRSASAKETLINMAGVYALAAKNNKAVFIGNSNSFYHNYSEMQSDSHPLVTGTRSIARNIKNVLLYGESFVNGIYIQYVTIDGTLGGTFNISLKQIQDGNLISLILTKNSTFVVTNASITTNTVYHIGSFNNVFVDSDAYLSLGTVPGWLYDLDTSKYTGISAEFLIKSDKLYMKIYYNGETTNGSLTFNTYSLDFNFTNLIANFPIGIT